MLAGDRYPKLLAPRGRGFTGLDGQVPIGAMQTGLEQTGNGLVRHAEFVAARTWHSRRLDPHGRRRGVRRSLPSDSACRSARAYAARRCALDSDVADRRVLPEPGWVSFTRMKNEE
ncbi:hypothetical protein [Bradyrhizobium sp. JR3.5]